MPSSDLDHLPQLAHAWGLVLLAVFRILNRDGLARPRILPEQAERVPQYVLLQLTHARSSQTISDFESFWIERAGWTHLRGNFRTNGNQDRRNSSHFDFPLDRYDRAVADARSTAGKHDRICAGRFVDLVSNLVCRSFIHRFELHGIAHVADVFLRNAAD